MIEDEKFFAWLDGELSPEEAAQVAAMVAADAELSRKAEEHRAMTAAIRGAFASVAATPVPERVTAAIHADQDNVVDFGPAHAAREARKTPLFARMAALAATLAVGIFTGNMLSGGASGPIRAEDGRLVAGGELETALYTQLASAPAQIGPRIGLTFRERSGATCRTFQDDIGDGLACHEGGAWRIRGLFQHAEGQASDYRMAGGPDPRLMDMVGESMAGEPFDADQEKAALARFGR